MLLLQQRWVEIKYALILLIAFALFLILKYLQLFTQINLAINNVLDFATKLGVIGLFLLAIVANSSMIFNIPYTLPLLAIALKNPDLPYILLLGFASGIGASIGKCIAYSIAEKLFYWEGTQPWIVQKIIQKPALTPFIIFGCILSFLPDETIIIPLASMRYGLRRMVLPMLLGKLLHTTIFSILVYLCADAFEEMLSSGAKANGAFLIFVLLILSIFYQFEKARPPDTQKTLLRYII